MILFLAPDLFQPQFPPTFQVQSTSPLLGSEREKTTPRALANPTYLAAKGSGSLLQECSKRKGHGKTEVKYFSYIFLM